MATSLNVREKKAAVDRWEGRVETPGDIEKQRDAELAKAKAILTRCEAEKRDLTTDENELHELLMDKVETLNEKMKEVMRGPAWNVGTRQVPPEPTYHERMGLVRRQTAGDSTYFVDPKSGARLPVLTRNEKFADLAPNPFPEIRNPIGSAIVAAVSGNTRGLPGEFRSMLSSITTSGGYLCDEAICAPLIDKGRANMVLAKAGCPTIAYETSTGSIARVETDPTAYVKGEGDAFTESAIVFGASTLTPRTCGIYCTLSRELAEDAINGAEEIENVIASAFAAKLDAWGLAGTDSQQPQGLIFQSGVGTNTSIGTINHDDFLDSVKTCMDANFDISKTATVVSYPAVWKTLVESKEATTNAYLRQPTVMDTWQWFFTTAMTGGYTVVGDFSQYAIALRQGIQIEVTSTGDTTFSKHLVAIKAHARVSFVCLRPGAFTVMSGIS